MEITKATNEELVKEQERLNDIFKKCQEKVRTYVETMDKAAIQYKQISDILKERNYDRESE